MSSLNETLARHGAQVKAARAEAEQTEAQRRADMELRKKTAESDPFKVVEARAEELAQKAMRVTTTSADISEILKAQGKIEGLRELIQFYTHAEVELRTARQQDG